PSRVAAPRGERAVCDEVAHLQVFKGNQVARRDERACLCAGMIFTLPVHLQMLFSQSVPRLLAVLAAFRFVGDPLLQLLEAAFWALRSWRGFATVWPSRSLSV